MLFLFALVASSLIALLWLASGVRSIGAISVGEPIGDREETALILIDLQEVFWDQGPYSEASRFEAEAVIQKEVNHAESKGFPVIAVRQEWSIPSTMVVARLAMKGQAVKGTPGTQLAEPFAGMADHVLVKRVQDAFETGELDALLSSLGVGRLRIVGLDLNHCVQKTALAARNRGYEVTIIEKGTLSSAPTRNAMKRMTSKEVVFQ